MDGYTLRNQEKEIYNVTMKDIREFTHIMAEDEYEFIVLSAPREINGISFLQAARYKEDIILQAGVQIDGKPDVMEKLSSKEECLKIFSEYFKHGETPVLSGFTRMKRM